MYQIQNNPLLVSINEYFKEMMSIESKLIVFDSFVSNATEEIFKQNRTHQQLIGAINTFRDLSKMSGENLFTTGYEYTLTLNELQNEIDVILSREYLFTLSQQYETFETFLANIFTEICYLFPENIVKLKIFDEQFPIPKATLRKIIKEKIGREKNNKKFLSGLKTLSPYFAKHEANNISKMNISTWYDVVSEVRHNVIHNRQVISDKLSDYLTHEEKKSIFEGYFESKQTKDGFIIFLSKNNFNQNFHLLNNLAFFIYKSLSVDNNLNPIYIKVPLSNS